VRATGGFLLLLLGLWSLAVGGLALAGPGLQPVDGLIGVGGLLCLSASALYFLDRGRWLALIAPLLAAALEGVAMLLDGADPISLAKLLLLLLALALGRRVGQRTKDLPAAP
jgi:hypothetical protein